MTEITVESPKMATEVEKVARIAMGVAIDAPEGCYTQVFGAVFSALWYGAPDNRTASGVGHDELERRVVELERCVRVLDDPLGDTE